MKISITSLLVALISLPTNSIALASPSPTKTQLKYFDLRGAAETCRILLALGGEDYNDVRYSFDPTTFKSADFENAKSSGDLKLNLNRAPLLVTSDGIAIGQSKAIERYLSKKFGLMGESLEEEAMIDCVAEHCRDVKDAARFKGFSKFSKGTEEEKSTKRKEWFTQDLPTMLKKVEDAVQLTSKEKGFAVGNSLTYADVAIWSLLQDCMEGDLEETKEAYRTCEALKAIVENISNHPKVAEWVEKRPVSMF